MGRCQPGRELVRGSRPAALSQQLLGGKGRGCFRRHFCNPPKTSRIWDDLMSGGHLGTPHSKNKGTQELFKRNFVAHPSLGSEPS